MNSDVMVYDVVSELKGIQKATKELRSKVVVLGVAERNNSGDSIVPTRREYTGYFNGNHQQVECLADTILMHLAMYQSVKDVLSEGKRQEVVALLLTARDSLLSTVKDGFKTFGGHDKFWDKQYKHYLVKGKLRNSWYALGVQIPELSELGSTKK